MSRRVVYLGATILALAFVVLVLSWCADQARIKQMRSQATVAAATGEALDDVVTETAVIRQEQVEKQDEVKKLNGAGLRLPDSFGRDLERVRRQRGEGDDPR